MNTAIKLNLPYYSQWESRKLIGDILNGMLAPSRDPKWKRSGASNPDEYEYWSWNICGMGCFKMILKDKFGKTYPLVDLAKKCQEYGGYKPDKLQSIGLYYREFCEFIRDEFGLTGRVRKKLTVQGIFNALQRGQYVIVSVSPKIRDPKVIKPPSTGGHLILVTGMDLKKRCIWFHNPSGIYGVSQEDVEMPIDRFKYFFAGRGITVK